ncbi:MAG: cytochrome P450 [Propionibacteriaceae bacterium]
MSTSTPTWPPSYRDDADPISPAPGYARLRAEAPVLSLPGDGPSAFWLVSGYTEVKELLAQKSVSTSFVGRGNVSAQPGFLLSLDPPDHTRLRRLLTHEFSMRRITGMRPWLEQVCGELLETMATGGAPADLMAAFAVPLPSLVICELLGVPSEDRVDFQRRSDTLLDVDATADEQRANSAEMNGYMRALVARHREQPGADILGMLVREHSENLSTDELVGIGNILLIAGHETTANTIGLGTLLLLQHPDQLAALRADPELITGAVEEILRFTSIVESGTPRIVTAEVSVGGTVIPAGDVVVVALPSANRDTDLLASPDRFDLRRQPVPHLAFGHGIHQCLGQQLARLEMAVAVPALFDRFPDLRLDTPAVELPFRTSSPVNGLRAFPVAW